MPEETTTPAQDAASVTDTNEAPEPQDGTDLTPDDLRAALDAARKDAAKYRTQLRERETKMQEAQKQAERAKLDEVERLKAELGDWEQKYGQLEQEATRERRRADLTGRVADPNAALKLLDDTHLDESGSINLDAFLQAYPFMATKTGPNPHTPTNPPSTKGGKPTSVQDFANKDQAYFDAHWDDFINTHKK